MDTGTQNASVWEDFRQWRKSSGMSQEEVASRLQVGQDTVSAWELMKRPPEWKYVPRIAALMGRSAAAVAVDIATAIDGNKYSSYA